MVSAQPRRFVTMSGPNVSVELLMNRLGVATAVFGLMAAMCKPGFADAAEIKVLSSGALKLALTLLLPDFEKSSKDTVTIEYGPAGSIASRVQRGEPADVAIVTASQLEDLERQGKIARGSRVNIAGIAIGVAVRKDAPKPDISTVEAFKQALLSSRAIGYRDPATGSTSGIYAARMIDRLGIAQDLRPKTRLDRSEGDRPENVFQALANGEIEMQIGQITEIVMAPGIELVGPLPAEIQNTTVLAAGVLATSNKPELATALINFLATPSTAAALKANGFQPAAKN
jgi:molybdate transport system substrate-binding protein